MFYQNRFLLIFILVLFISCKSNRETIEVNKNGVHNQEQLINNTPSKKEKDIDNLNEKKNYSKEINDNNIYINCEIDFEKSTLNVLDNLYKLQYKIDLKFININLYGYEISTEIFDKYDNLILTNIQVLKNDNKLNFIFSDYICHNILKYKIIFKKNNNQTILQGSIKNNLPYIDSVNKIIVSDFVDNEKNVSLNLSFSIISNFPPEKIYLVSPDQKTFWELNYTGGIYTFYIESKVSYSDHKNYIFNGNYTIQILFGKHGLIQEEININDYFGNKTGPNYGLVTISEKINNSKYFELDYDKNIKSGILMLKLYTLENNSLIEIGQSNSLPLSKNNSKNSIIFRNNTGEEIQFNKKNKYYYKYIIETEDNGSFNRVSSKLYLINLN